MDPLFEDDSLLQVHMLEAWQEKGKRIMREMPFIIAHPMFFVPGTKAMAEKVFQYYGQWYAYWVQFGHREEVNSGK